ncbi:WD40-repeat-containing domain protein [Baffinella frigidus]|nr:WD40-repeat-containing domain protein [Cryptophyta sp. CCMP2293]
MAPAGLLVWIVATSSVVRVLSGHTGGINALRILPPSEGRYARRAQAARGEAAAADSGPHLLSCSDDGSVKDWHISSGRCDMTLLGHTAPVVSAAACTALDVAAGGAQDCLVRTWRLSDGARLALIRHDAPLAFVSVSSHADALATVATSGVLRLWDIRSIL